MASSKPGVTTIRQHNAGTYYAGILLALVLISIGPIPPDGFAQNAPETVSIPDLSLRAALEDSLGLSPGDPITGAALAKLTVLEVGDAGILDLTGLEHATGLARLDLGPGATRDPWANTNSVSDLSSLSGMTDLTWLSLAGNSVVDVTPLSGLGLTSLNLEVNGISDVTSLVPPGSNSAVYRCPVTRAWPV